MKIVLAVLSLAAYALYLVNFHDYGKTGNDDSLACAALALASGLAASQVASLI